MIRVENTCQATSTAKATTYRVTGVLPNGSHEMLEDRLSLDGAARLLTALVDIDRFAALHIERDPGMFPWK